MDLHRLQQLLRRESDRVEWKHSGKNADDVLHPACALANDLGGSREEGFVLFGVNKDGNVIGIDTHGQRLDEIQQQTSSRLTSTAIYPTPSFDLEAVETSGKTVLDLDDVPTAVDGIRAGFSPRFPVEALKELARNLVQHRQYEGTHAPGRVEWFDDRIEFSNPGGPFGRASEGTFGDHSDYRNPSITKGLVELGYVQQLGRGIRRARLELERNGCPPLEVGTDGFTRVIVRARP